MGTVCPRRLKLSKVGVLMSTPTSVTNSSRSSSTSNFEKGGVFFTHPLPSLRGKGGGGGEF